ncbi:MAG: hypothetical protein ACTHK7_17840 [Aureliella sp.]
MKIRASDIRASWWYRAIATRNWLKVGGLTLGCWIATAPLAWAQRGDWGGGDRGSWRGGDSGGFRGGFGGGPPGGFGGGPPGGFSPGGFSPIDMLKRFDRNSNGMLDPDEREGPARFFLERMAQNNPRIDLNRPVPLDRLAAEMDRMRQERMGGSPGGGPTGAPGTSTKPAEPEPLVPGFDKVEELPAVQGFGLADENSSIKIEERDLREAEDRIKRYDNNKDGVLSQDELSRGRWSEDPMQFDRNRDGKLNKSELAVRYAKRRLGDQPQPGGSNNSSDPRSRMASMSPWGGGGWSGRGGDSRGGDSRGGFSGGPGGFSGGGPWGGRGGDSGGGGWGSRDDGGGDSSQKDKKADAKSYRSGSTRDKADSTKGLPDWFARSDANGDGQVMMHEYSTLWTDDKVAEFAKFDLNSDGIITGRECLASLKNGASAPSVSSSTSSTASSSSSSSTTASASTSSTASPDEARLQWAKRLIDKYDTNKDGQLTVDEWSAMVIKPDGADANKDGIITLEEYAQFRK